MKEGETTNDLYGFLTTAPNVEVKAIHPEAMPVVLTTPAEVDAWLIAPTERRWLCNDRCLTGHLRSSPAGTKQAMGHRADLPPSSTASKTRNVVNAALSILEPPAKGVPATTTIFRLLATHCSLTRRCGRPVCAKYHSRVKSTLRRPSRPATKARRTPESRLGGTRQRRVRSARCRNKVEHTC
jgi:hypothetical protein